MLPKRYRNLLGLLGITVGIGEGSLPMIRVDSERCGTEASLFQVAQSFHAASDVSLYDFAHGSESNSVDDVLCVRFVDENAGVIRVE